MRMATMLRRASDYVARPTVFFREQLRGAPDWWLAFAAPILCSCLVGIAATVLGHRARGAQVDLLRHLDVPIEMLPPPPLMTISTMLGYPAWYAMALLALLSINVFYKDVAQPPRLAEFTGLCFLTQIPLCLLTIAMVLNYEPAPFRPTAGISRLAALDAFIDHQNASAPLFIIRMVFYASALWLASQLAAALKVAGRLSTRAAVGSALFLALLFAGVQLAVSML